MRNKAIIQEYRTLIGTLTRFPRGAVPDNEDVSLCLYHHLNQQFETFLAKFHLHLVKSGGNVAASLPTEWKLMLFTASIGLVTFGRKDVIPFILQDMAQIERLASLTSIVLKLLPLPEHLQDLNKKTEILDWLEIHYDQLTWDEEKEGFYLKEEG